MTAYRCVCDSVTHELTAYRTISAPAPMLGQPFPNNKAIGIGVGLEFICFCVFFSELGSVCLCQDFLCLRVF